MKAPTMMLAALTLATAAGWTPAMPGKPLSVREWTEQASTHLGRYRFRQARVDRDTLARPVAVVCSEATAVERKFAEECDALRHEFASGLRTSWVTVVEPVTDLTVVREWDQLGCGRFDPAEKPGLEILEIRVLEKRRNGLVVRLEPPPWRTEIYSGWVDLGELRRRPAPWSTAPPFTVSDDHPRAESVASFMARAVACAVKAQPEKHRIRDVVIDGDLESPQQAAWLHRVGAVLANHVNRLVQSGYYVSSDATLYLRADLEPLGRRSRSRDAFRISTEISEGATTIAVGPDVGEHPWVVNFVDALRRYLGDLSTFGSNVTAASRYLQKRGVLPIIKRIPDDGVEGRIIGQRPAPDTAIASVSRVTILVAHHDPPTPLSGRTRQVTPRPQTRPRGPRPRPEDLQTKIHSIADRFSVSPASRMACLSVVHRPTEERQAFEELLRDFDPRKKNSSPITLWQAWFGFAHPGYPPYFDDSPLNGYVKEVADALYLRVHASVSQASP